MKKKQEENEDSVMFTINALVWFVFGGICFMLFGLFGLLIGMSILLIIISTTVTKQKLKIKEVKK